jgi:hypothetical protein
VLLPASVEFGTVSADNTYTILGTVANDVLPNTEGPAAKTFALDFPETAVRYIRVHAVSAGDVPAGFPDAGKKALLFADEIAVQ